jgi:hypothetical protein
VSTTTVRNKARAGAGCAAARAVWRDQLLATIGLAQVDWGFGGWRGATADVGTFSGSLRMELADASNPCDYGCRTLSCAGRRNGERAGCRSHVATRSISGRTAHTEPQGDTMGPSSICAGGLPTDLERNGRLCLVLERTRRLWTFTRVSAATTFFVNEAQRIR